MPLVLLTRIFPIAMLVSYTMSMEIVDSLYEQSYEIASFV